LRIFKVKNFAKFAKRERIRDTALRDAIDRALRGAIDADLGGHVIKQRVARPGQGKSGGYRVIVAFHGKNRSLFLYGFGKSEQDNVDPKELRTLQELAAAWLGASEEKIETALENKLLMEIV